MLPRAIPLLRLLLTPNVHTARESGEALARLALASDVEGVSGQYFEGVKATGSSHDSDDRVKQDDLWDWTVAFLGADQLEVESYEELS